MVEASEARWFVLSALYGLVTPDTEIAPYDYTLNTVGIAERKAWATRVLDKLGTQFFGVDIDVIGEPLRHQQPEHIGR